MKYIFIFLFFNVVLFTKSLSGQYLPLVQENKYWVVLDFQGTPRPTTGFLITLKGDTVLNNMIYKKAYKYELFGTLIFVGGSPPQFMPDLPYTTKNKKLVALVREDLNTKKVYNLPIKQDSCIFQLINNINSCNNILFCDTNEHLLFDFSLVQGDTLDYCTYAPLHYDWEIQKEKVDSIKNEFKYGKERKTFYTFGVPGFLPNLQSPGPILPTRVKIFEGLGFEFQGIFNYRWGTLHDFCEGTLEQCNIINNTNDARDMQADKIEIFPNPASDYIKLQTSKTLSNVEIIDQNGKVVLNDRALEINVGSLQAGMYFVKCLSNENASYFGKFIKL